jgi:mono/diheme cytochrome c family protein
LTVVVAALLGCGSAPRPPAAAQSGAEIFSNAGCGACHTLATAHATGTVGPNLDRLKPDTATVVRQVAHGGGGMPSFAGELTPAQIRAVAAYVTRATHAQR